MNYVTRHREDNPSSNHNGNYKFYMCRESNGRVWLWPDYEYAADYIYCGYDTPDKREDGFYGSTLKFELVDGGTIELYGPWHTNSDSMKQSIGVDITDKHATFVVIGLDRRPSKESWMGEIIDVLYIDDCWKCSEYDRGDKLAKKYANKLNRKVCLYSEGSGGSSCGFVYPENNNA